jgi:hypothetical protein
MHCKVSLRHTAALALVGWYLMVRHLIKMATWILALRCLRGTKTRLTTQRQSVQTNSPGK